MTSLDQRRLALARANDVRFRRADLKRNLRTGQVSFVDALTDPPAWLLTATIYELLLEVPRVGPTKAKRMLRRSGIQTATTFDSILGPQRRRLLEDLFQTVGRRA